MAKRSLQSQPATSRPAAANGPPERPAADRPAADRPAADRIVDVARELFCRDGIHATGIDRILSAAGASKMTLYTRFGSKEALVREVLQREGADWRENFFAAVLAGGADALTQLHHVVPALAAWFDSGRFYGCSFMNAAAEHSKGDPMLREMAADHHRQILAFLQGLTETAEMEEPAFLARQILLTIDGTIAALMVLGDPLALVVAERNLRSILKQNQPALQIN